MSYLEAKARTRSKVVHSAIIISTEETGVYLYVMAAHGGMVLPFGRTWHASEADAKQHCLETMKIRLTDWIARDGEPEFVAPFTKAVDQAVKNYNKAVRERGNPPAE